MTAEVYEYYFSRDSHFKSYDLCALETLMMETGKKDRDVKWMTREEGSQEIRFLLMFQDFNECKANDSFSDFIECRSKQGIKETFEAVIVFMPILLTVTLLLTQLPLITRIIEDEKMYLID